jgi:hypothetical protein
LAPAPDSTENNGFYWEFVNDPQDGTGYFRLAHIVYLYEAHIATAEGNRLERGKAGLTIHDYQGDRGPSRSWQIGFLKADDPWGSPKWLRSFARRLAVKIPRP